MGRLTGAMLGGIGYALGAEGLPQIPVFQIESGGDDNDSFAAALDSEWSCSVACFVLCAWISCNQLCLGADRCCGDWVVQCDAGVVFEDHYVAAGDSDVWTVFSGNQCGDSLVLEQVCAGVCCGHLQGGFSWSAGAGGAAFAVRVLWKCG